MKEQLTREDAIDQLSMMYCYDTLPLRIAKDMGIKALMQGFYGDQIKPILGYWQKIYDPYKGKVFHCSVCGFQKAEFDKFKYCPNCGAKMLK